MNYPERLQADRRAQALKAWRGLERRQAQRRAIDNARTDHWLERFHAARAFTQGD